jgi:ribosomal protein L1
VEDIKKKKGGHIHVKTDSNKVVIFAIPKTNAKAIQEHVKIFHKYPDQKIRGTIHFSTKTGQTITTILGDITDLMTYSSFISCI